MKLPNPAKILRDGKAIKEKREEAVKTLQSRLRYAFDKKNKEERYRFTEQLKKKNIQPIQLLRITEEAAKGRNVLLKWEYKIGQEGKAETLANVRDRSTFSRLLVIVRDLYAEDIASDIPFDRVANLVLEEILFHP